MNSYAVQTTNILAILFYTILLLHASLYNWCSFKFWSVLSLLHGVILVGYYRYSTIYIIHCLCLAIKKTTLFHHQH